jgi:hypothetical protein
MVPTISCSCGDMLSSQDEEKLYTFIHAHAVRRHPECHRTMLASMPDSPSSSGMVERKGSFQRWSASSRSLDPQPALT